jgi:hypothetical protein
MNIPKNVKEELDKLTLKNSHNPEAYYTLYNIMWMRLYNSISKTKQNGEKN